MNDVHQLKLYVEEFDNFDALEEERGESVEHLRNCDGKFGVVWSDVTRPEDECGKTWSTGLPGCLETTLPVAERIRDCVNAMTGIKDPAELRRQRDDLADLCEDMRYLLGANPQSKENANAIRRAEKQFDRIMSRINS